MPKLILQRSADNQLFFDCLRSYQQQGHSIIDTMQLIATTKPQCAQLAKQIELELQYQPLSECLRFRPGMCGKHVWKIIRASERGLLPTRIALDFLPDDGDFAKWDDSVGKVRGTTCN